MDTPEIRFLNNREVYYLKKYDITVKEYEEQIKNIEYEKFYSRYRGLDKNNAVENANLPYVVFVFYKFFFFCNKIPDAEKLIDSYFKTYNHLFKKSGASVIYNNCIYSKNALIARILRTYPRLIRDFHFYLSLVEDNTFDKVIYSYQRDINGTDILIVHNNAEYAVSLFVNTTRSTYFKKIKNERRHNYSENQIQFPLNLNNAKVCGDFRLYGAEYIEKLKEIILKK